MSFEKEFDDDIDFFTVEDSLIAGTDFIKGEGDVVQEWDKYAYIDMTDRVMGIEWDRQIDPLASIALSTADVIFDNHDDFFTPGQGSEIDGNILPYRPIRIFAGFGEEAIPVFIGLTEKMPVIDEKNKRVSFHCIDYLYSLFNRPLDEEVMYQDMRTDEIISQLLQSVGLLEAQFDLDPGFTIIPFAYFAKGRKLYNVINQLMEVEQGRIYLDENGVIRFRNRQSYSNDAVMNFNAYDNILEAKTRQQDDIINVVEIRGKPRTVASKQKYWELVSPVLVKAGSTKEVWADFLDPVTSVDEPVYITSATTSLFTTNTKSDGSGTNNDTDVTVTDTDLFSTSYKITFTNAAAYDIYITSLELFATPALADEKVYVREQDDDSVTKYDERVVTIDNDYFQNEDIATSRALVILDDYSQYGSIQEIEVKGNPALQLDDPVFVDVYGVNGTYRISRINSKIMQGKFTQILTLKDFTRRTYFTAEVSMIQGDDGIAP